MIKDVIGLVVGVMVLWWLVRQLGAVLEGALAALAVALIIKLAIGRLHG